MTTVVHSPDNCLPRIDAVWMAVSVDAAGNEGLCAVLQGGVWVPLIAADERRLEWIIALAQHSALQTGKRVKVITLTVRTEIMEIPSHGGGHA